MYYNDDESVEIEKTDNCYTCKHFSSGKPCPLLEALYLGAVFFEEELGVNNCSWYEKKGQHLKVVKLDKTEEKEAENL